MTRFFRFADYDSFADSGREQISRCIVCQRKLNAADDNFSDYSGHSGSIGPFISQLSPWPQMALQNRFGETNY